MRITARVSCRIARGSALVVVWLCLLVAPANAEPLQPGDAAPLYREIAARLAEKPDDGLTSAPLVLLFVKAEDTYSSRMIDQLYALEERADQVLKEARILVMHSRVRTPSERLTYDIPQRWTMIRDSDDAFYSAYGIIATPTAAVIGRDGRVLGFHPGYSPGLARMIQRDLLVELRGSDTLRTPAAIESMELQLGRRLVDRGLWERAIVYYRQLQAKGPLEPAIELELARILVELGEREEALEILERLHDLPGAADLRARALNGKPGD